MSNIVDFPQKLDVRHDYTWKDLFFQNMKNDYTVSIGCITWDDDGKYNFIPVAEVELEDKHVAYYLHDEHTGMFHFERMIVADTSLSDENHLFDEALDMILDSVTSSENVQIRRVFCGKDWIEFPGTPETQH